MNHKTREILITGTGEVPERDVILRKNIQVRRGVPLPDLGQRVVVMDEHRIIKYAGEVVDVDFENYTYDVQLRKSNEAPAPSFTRGSKNEPGQAEREEVAERIPSNQIKKNGNGMRRLA